MLVGVLDAPVLSTIHFQTKILNWRKVSDDVVIYFISFFKHLLLNSGGKDSCFNMMHCVAQGHEVVALANLKPSQQGETRG